jgi:ATP-dependent Clp protease ATP-binding subunit ClpB
MQKEIDDRLAKQLLAGNIRDGHSVRVDVADDGQSLVVEPFELDPLPETQEERDR